MQQQNVEVGFSQHSPLSLTRLQHLFPLSLTGLRNILGFLIFSVCNVHSMKVLFCMYSYRGLVIMVSGFFLACLNPEVSYRMKNLEGIFRAYC